MNERVARALFYAAGSFALVMALIPKPPHLPGGFSDKLQHGAAFATLGLLGTLGYTRLSSLRLIAALSVYGAVIELLQALPFIHRDCDPLDWVADTVACTVAVLALRWWQGRQR